MEGIDLRGFIHILLKRWWILAAVAFICTAASIALSFFILTPIYQSSTTMYIGKNADSTGDLVYNDVLLGSQLVKDYRELAKSRLVTETVVKDLGLKNMTAKKLSDKLGVNLKNDTRVIEITADDQNPGMAQKIASKVAEVFKEKVVEIMQVENVKVIDTADYPVDPVRPNKKLNVAAAFILGLAGGTGTIFLLEYLDNTIKTPDDVKKYAELPVIGTIPVFPE